MLTYFNNNFITSIIHPILNIIINQKVSNKLFTRQNIQHNTNSSKIRTNREYLISQDTAEDINTYRYFGVFPSYNEVQTVKRELDGDKVKETYGGIGTPAVRSIFNRAGSILIGTDGLDVNNITAESLRTKSSGYRISTNTPLFDSQEVRKKIREDSGCTVKELVEKSGQGYLGRAIYSYADFMFCKYLGQIPNNYLITLRRFPIPPGDNISTIGTGKNKLGAGKNYGGQQIGCMVTWMGTPGNDMSNLLKYSFNMPYSEVKAEWQEVNSGADNGKGMLNGIAAAFDSSYRKQYISGHGGSAFNNFANTFFKVPFGPGYSDGPYETSFIDKNNNVKLYGNIDKVKTIYRRGEEGLAFDQSITIVFDYELRAYNGINARQAMLDLLSNILNVTFTTGGWWGGGYIGTGMHQNSIFNNMEIFKCKGGFTEFMDAFQKDYHTISSGIQNQIKAQGGFLNTIKNLLNNLGGMLLGGMLNSLGRPARAATNSLLSEQPTGMWHLMIGNPNHPIMSMGNMVLKNTTIQHFGPLGIDDFPTNLRVTCELTRGKGKDLNEIEKMYMHGNDKISYSMGSKVLDMYKKSAEYKSNTKPTIKKSENTKGELPSNKGKDTSELPVAVKVASNMDWSSVDMYQESATDSLESSNERSMLAELGVPDITETSKEILNSTNSMLQKWFGETDNYSIYFAAAEQSWGAQRKKKEEETKKQS